MKTRNGSPADAEAIEEAVLRAFTRFESAGTVGVPAVVNLFLCRT